MPPRRTVRSRAPNPASNGAALAFPNPSSSGAASAFLTPSSSGAAPGIFESGTFSDTSSVPDDNSSGTALTGLGSRTISGVSIELFAYHDEPNSQSLVAVYHNDYRHVWIAEYDTSLYAHPRAQGPMTNDITCFYAPHQQWGPAREDWPDILFQIEPDKERPKRWTKPSWLFTREGWVVLGWNSKPVIDYAMPLCLSSVLEDYILEAIMRENYYDNIGVPDIQARMPGTISANGKAPSRSATISMRMQRFRKKSGSLTWLPKPGSDGIATYLAMILPDECWQANSTRGFRSLWRHEIAEAELQNIGKYPHKARPSNRDLSDKKRYEVIVKAWNKYMELKQSFEAEHRTTVPTQKTLQDYLDAAGLSQYNGADRAATTSPDTATVVQRRRRGRPLRSASGFRATGSKFRATSGRPAVTSIGSALDFIPGYTPSPSNDVNRSTTGPASNNSSSAYAPAQDTNPQHDHLHTTPPSTAAQYDHLSSEPSQVHHVDLNNLLIGPSRWHFQNLTWDQPPYTDITASYLERYRHLKTQLEAYFAEHASENEVPVLIGVEFFDPRGVVRWNLPWDNDMMGPMPDLEMLMYHAGRG